MCQIRVLWRFEEAGKMIDLLFVIVISGFAIESAMLYEIYQLASDVRRQLAERTAPLPTRVNR
jgi:hypothetical protein